jgi:hypothetical protein
LAAAHNQQHCPAPFQEFIWEHVLLSPHYHDFCKCWAKSSMQLPSIAMTMFFASSSWPARPRKSTMQV